MIVMNLGSGKQIEDLRMLANELSRMAMGTGVNLYQEPSTGELYVEWYQRGLDDKLHRHRMEIQDNPEDHSRGPVLSQVD